MKNKFESVSSAKFTELTRTQTKQIKGGLCPTETLNCSTYGGGCSDSCKDDTDAEGGIA